MKWSFKNIKYNNSLDFNKDIFGSELFYLIKLDFIKNISKVIPTKITEIKKNKNRILDNLFCHWYFWDAYSSNYPMLHPLLLDGTLNYLGLRNILVDYFNNSEDLLDVDNIIRSLDLESKLKRSIKLLEDGSIIKCRYILNENDYNIKIKLTTEIDVYNLYINKKLGNKILKVLGEEKFVRLLFRYYVLGSNNNQLATNSKKLNEINPDIELFSSGFNNNGKKFCSLFPDLEYELGSLGRFQDIKIQEGIYQINPPFQTAIIYDILKRIKVWMDDANKSEKKLEFHLFLPNWLENNNILKYSKYLVLDMLNDINCEKEINNYKNSDFDYIDYLNDKIRNYTLPDTLYLVLKN